MPSYVALSMYSDRGVCRPRRDRPQCKHTVDLCINQDKPWPIYVENLDTQKRMTVNTHGDYQPVDGDSVRVSVATPPVAPRSVQFLN